MQIRAVANDAARLAALLSGDVDLIDHVPQTDLPRVRETKALLDRFNELSMNYSDDTADEMEWLKRQGPWLGVGGAVVRWSGQRGRAGRDEREQ